MVEVVIKAMVSEVEKEAEKVLIQPLKMENLVVALQYPFRNAQIDNFHQKTKMHNILHQPFAPSLSMNDNMYLCSEQTMHCCHLNL